MLSLATRSKLLNHVSCSSQGKTEVPDEAQQFATIQNRKAKFLNFFYSYKLYYFSNCNDRLKMTAKIYSPTKPKWSSIFRVDNGITPLSFKDGGTTRVPE